MTVLVAREGDHALSIVEKVTPDVILMDAVMPGTDGFETCRRLKQNRALAHVPVIFMTGLSDTEHIVEGLEAGGVDYVTKPIVAGRASGADSRASDQRAHGAKRAHGTRCVRPLSSCCRRRRQGAVVYAASRQNCSAPLCMISTPKTTSFRKTSGTGSKCTATVASPPLPIELKARASRSFSFSTSARSARTSISFASSKAMSATIRWSSNPGS